MNSNHICPSHFTIIMALFMTFLPTCGWAQNYQGDWDAALQTPGGELRFGLRLTEADGKWTASLVNGLELIAVPECRIESQTLILDITHYDSRIEATYDPKLAKWTGTWSKRRGAEKWARVPFAADQKTRDSPSATTLMDDFVGKWRVKFKTEDAPSVGLFQPGDNRQLWGTFLTTLGDYRYLAGRVAGREMELSCFDGAHAFLFKARLQADGALKGDFWSGDWWHDTWTAERDDQAALPDGFSISKINEDAPLSELHFTDLDGNDQLVIREQDRGKPLLIEIFGSWCPNCHDAGAYLSELEQRYAPRGLRIMGIAFELTGDPEHDAAQVRQYVKRHAISFPVLVGGLSDKEEATRQMRVLDQVRAYPTILFVDRKGQASAVYTGFNGPATGEANLRMQEQFELKIEELLREHEPVQARSASE